MTVIDPTNSDNVDLMNEYVEYYFNNIFSIQY
jgi:hypothetical protein